MYVKTRIVTDIGIFESGTKLPNSVPKSYKESFLKAKLLCKSLDEVPEGELAETQRKTKREPKIEQLEDETGELIIHETDSEDETIEPDSVN